MNTIKTILITCTLILSLSSISGIAVAVDTKTGMTQPINKTIADLEAALAAVNDNDLNLAQERIKAARQSSKDIIGGTLAPKTSRGSSAIKKAFRHAKKGNTEKTVAALNKALEIFKSMKVHLPSETTGSRGGLN